MPNNIVTTAHAPQPVEHFYGVDVGSNGTISLLSTRPNDIHASTSTITNPDWYSNLTKKGREEFDVFKRQLEDLLAANPKTEQEPNIPLNTLAPIKLPNLGPVALVPFLQANNIILFNANLRQANLRQANLEHANLEHANLEHANLEHANLRQANLFKANLFKANLFNANLFKANLTQANLFNADLRQADLREANLFNADLGNANLVKANLFKASLRKAHLFYADLEQANLFNADLRQADLEHANLFNADLRQADLEQANLFNADLRQADLQNTRFYSSTELSGAVLNNIKGKTIILDDVRYDIASQKEKITEWFRAKGATISFAQAS